MRSKNVILWTGLTILMFNVNIILAQSKRNPFRHSNLARREGGRHHDFLAGLENTMNGIVHKTEDTVSKTVGKTEETVENVTENIDDMLTTIFHGSQCPNPKPSKHRPNGCVEFLTCGINDSRGWSPAPVKLEQLKVISGEEAVKKPTFKACKKFLHHFKKMAKKHGIPEIVPMSFSIQESSCNPKEVGGNGEIGMMQVTPENCKRFGVKPHRAFDPEINIELGIKVFKAYLDQYHGNILEAAAAYNGWNRGMTKSQAESTKYGCFAQRNLDYLDQLMNGFFRGHDGHTKEYTTFDNLAKCGDDG